MVAETDLLDFRADSVRWRHFCGTVLHRSLLVCLVPLYPSFTRKQRWLYIMDESSLAFELPIS